MGVVYWFRVSAYMFSYVARESVRTCTLSSSLTDVKLKLNASSVAGRELTVSLSKLHPDEQC